jgi:hypothetical protein
VLLVEMTDERTTYSLREGESLTVRHFDQEITLMTGTPATLPVPPLES